MVGMMNEQGIIIKRGDSFDILMHFKNDGGVDINLKGCKILMTVKEDEETKPLLLIKGEIVSDVEGKARIKLMPKHTKIAPKDYVTDIQLTLKNGSIYTVYPTNPRNTAIFRIEELIKWLK